MKIYILLICIIIISFLSCNTTEPPILDNNLLTIEDVSCTEAWLKINLANISLPVNVNISKDDKIVAQISNLSYRDTVFYIDSLLPNKTYTFKAQAYGAQNSETRVNSNEVTVTTLDITSHNFTWQTFTFGGDAGSSSFYDVAIINENCIYAVGEVYLKDSLGNYDPNAYNLAYWDGSKWELKRVSVEFRGNKIILPLEGIFAFSPTDIWLVGSLPIHGDGENWKIFDLRTSLDPNLSLSKAWGSSSEYIYFVGRNGSIAHYQKGKWTKIESGTNTDIYDIWGYDNKDKLVLFSGYQEIFKITNSNTSEKIDIKLNKRIRAVWFNSTNKIYAAGDGIFSTTDMINWKEEDVLNEYATFKIRGTNYNNIFAAGGFGFTAHFNGAAWKVMEEAALQSGNYYSLDVKENITAMVGSNGISALITIGKRQ